MIEYTLLTGASSGIGFEMAKQLAEKKHNLILVARNQDKLETLQKDLKNQFKIDIAYFPFDLSKPNAAQDLYMRSKDTTI